MLTTLALVAMFILGPSYVGLVIFALMGDLMVGLVAVVAFHPPKARPRRKRPRRRTDYGDNVPAGAILRLNALTHDTATSERLLADCKRENPGRDWAWVLDKVCYQLKRDRLA
jgi:hypothetical protein